MTKQYALLFDLRRCIGCRTCVIACKLENNLEVGDNWIQVFSANGSLNDSPQGKYPQLSLVWRPVACMHCQNPPCRGACPEEAIYKREDGIVLIDEKKCTGCLLCQPACPYDVIHFKEGENLADKCTLCCHRIDQGLIPNCARECIWGAILFGDINDPKSKVAKLIARRKGFVLKPEKKSLPSNHYLPPV